MKDAPSTSRRRRALTLSLSVAAMTLAPTIAAAAEAATTEVDPKVAMAKYIAAGGAMAVSAAAAGFAQAKIGAAAAGTLAERPEAATMLIVLQVLPEIIVLLGFVTALIISG